MDEQLYKDLIHYLTTLTFMDGLTDKWKTHIRRISTQYISKNNILYRNTKEGIRKVILPEQVELILYHLHKDMSGAHLGKDGHPVLRLLVFSVFRCKRPDRKDRGPLRSYDRHMIDI
jgi:hypothetical protein